MIGAMFWMAVLLVSTIVVMVILTGFDDDTCPSDMYCYEPYGAPIAAEHVLAGTLVAVNFMPPEYFPDGIEAYALWEVDYDNNLSYCIIYVQWPENVLGDPRMDAIGHELLHCITGEFHP